MTNNDAVEKIKTSKLGPWCKALILHSTNTNMFAENTLVYSLNEQLERRAAFARPTRSAGYAYVEANGTCGLFVFWLSSQLVNIFSNSCSRSPYPT